LNDLIEEGKYEGRSDIIWTQMTTVIWWWNAVLGLHYLTIIWAILQIVICRNSSPCLKHFWTPFVINY